MKRTLLASILIVLLMVVAGCGDGHKEPTLFTTDILSNAINDGDIERTPSGVILPPTQGNTEKVFVGVDPVTGNESRAFLDFSLDSVPPNAVINSATLHLFINSIAPVNATVPVTIDLITFDPPTLISDDFDRILQRPLATTTIQPPINPNDFGQPVPVDVTSLMVDAQNRRLPALQLRLFSDGIPGLVEINDTIGINRQSRAPLLEVTYF